MVLKIAWGICGSGDSIKEILDVVQRITEKEGEKIKLYIFLSKAAQFVVNWYGLKKKLEDLTIKIFNEIDANKTEPFYYLPGALQLGKFNFFLICPATANTVAKLVNGIADTLITNSAAQAAKANIPIYIFPVDNKTGVQKTILPNGTELSLYMRNIDIQNTGKLDRMENFHVFSDISNIRNIIEEARTSMH